MQDAGVVAEPEAHEVLLEVGGPKFPQNRLISNVVTESSVMRRPASNASKDTQVHSMQLGSSHLGKG